MINKKKRFGIMNQQFLSKVILISFIKLGVLEKKYIFQFILNSKGSFIKDLCGDIYPFENIKLFSH